MEGMQNKATTKKDSKILPLRAQFSGATWRVTVNNSLHQRLTARLCLYCTITWKHNVIHTKRRYITYCIVGSRPSDHYFRSVCLSVCLCRVFLSRLWSDFDQTRTCIICLGLVVSPEYRGCATPGGWVTLKKLVFLGVLGLKKTISSYSFDRIVLIFGHIVERTNTKILSSHFFAISILNPNYDVINDVISGFAPPAMNHHSVAASYHRRTESRPQVTCTENFCEVGTCGFWDVQADRHTDTLIAIPCTSPGGEVTKYITVQ